MALLAIEQRSVSAERGSLVSLWGLLGLFIVKGTVGWLTGSKALLADACHTAADCACTVTSYLGIRKARVDPNAAGSIRQLPRLPAAVAGIAAVPADAEDTLRPGWEVYFGVSSVPIAVAAAG